MVHKQNFGFISSLAPHMLRGTDQKDWVPEGADCFVSSSDPSCVANDSIDSFVKKLLHLDESCKITSVMLEFSAQEVIEQGNLLLCPRLDNLASVYSSIVAIVSSLKKSAKETQTRMIFAFNNEEVGSQTRAGAEGPAIINWWARLSQQNAEQLY